MYLLFKRVFDFFFSALGLILISPLFIPIVLLLKLTGEGEVFYFQERIGYQFRQFNIWKFATMLKNSPNMGNKSVTLRNDPRITTIGKYLRITKINELPQIINVILGDMSLVGPRPLLYNSYKKYTKEVQEVIYKNRPGITGIGSLIFRDEEKLISKVKQLGGEPLEYYRDHIYPYKGKLEYWYYQNISFTTDLKILLLTFWQILFSESDLTYKILQQLPKRPHSLTLEGINRLYSEIA